MASLTCLGMAVSWAPWGSSKRLCLAVQLGLPYMEAWGSTRMPRNHTESLLPNSVSQASHKASPDSKGKEIDSTYSWKEQQSHIEKEHAVEGNYCVCLQQQSTIVRTENVDITAGIPNNCKYGHRPVNHCVLPHQDQSIMWIKHFQNIFVSWQKRSMTRLNRILERIFWLLKTLYHTFIDLKVHTRGREHKLEINSQIFFCWPLDPWLFFF